MNTADTLYDLGIKVPEEIDRKFDSALLGYLVRHDTKGIPAYDRARFDLLLSTMDMTFGAWFSQIKLVGPVPSYKIFGALIDDGVLVWEALNTAIVGIISATKEDQPTILVYSYDKCLQIIEDSFSDSEMSDIREAAQLYFETEIMLADMGPHSPYILRGGDYSPLEVNGLGSKSVLPLPSGRRSIVTYINKVNARKNTES